MATSKIQSHGWELIQEGTYQTTGTLDFSKYSELLIMGNPPGSGAWMMVTIPTLMLTTSKKHFTTNSPATGYGAVICAFWVGVNGMYLASNVNGGDTSGSTPFKIYGKK